MISKTVMTMKGNGNTRKGKKPMEKSELWLKRKPFTYRRINSDWQRGLARDDWASNPSHLIDPVDDQPLENLKCPECNQDFPVKTLRIKTGFHSLKPQVPNVPGGWILKAMELFMWNAMDEMTLTCAAGVDERVEHASRQQSLKTQSQRSAN